MPSITGKTISFAGPSAIDVSLKAGREFNGNTPIPAGIRDVVGGSSDDVITGNGRGNGFLGGNGDDNLSGRDGDDVLTGGAGDDFLNGGAASDTASYAGAATGIFAQLSGVRLGFAFGDATGVDTLIKIENLTGSAHDDVLIGSNKANILDGGGGSDVLMGGGGADTFAFHARGNDGQTSYILDFRPDEGDIAKLFAGGRSVQVSKAQCLHTDFNGVSLGNNGHMDTRIDITGGHFTETVWLIDVALTNADIGHSILIA